MKNLKDRLVNESRTGDFFMTVAECIKDPKNITDADVKKIIKTVNKYFGFTLSEEEAKSMAESAVRDFPEMFEK